MRWLQSVNQEHDVREIEVAVEAQIIHLRTDRIMFYSLVFNMLESALTDRHRDSLVSLSIRA